MCTYIIRCDFAWGEFAVRLNITSIKQIEGKSKDFKFEEILDGKKVKREIISSQNPIKVYGTVKNVGNRIIEVIGSIDFKANTYCYRCLEKTQIDLKTDFNLKFSDRVFDYSSEKNDEDIFFFSGNDIELSPHIINEIVLHWPSQVLCKPDCNGLCPHCGKNLNKIKCSCKEDETDPRLAVLKKLLK